MTTPSLLKSLLALGCALAFPACTSRQTSAKFTALRVSTYRGETLSEYVARGPVQKVEGGFKIHAVERRSAPPYAQRSRYPYGWDTTVLGPRIHRWETEKPDWLAAWEDEHGEVWGK
jgi:hypothetical protein